MRLTYMFHKFYNPEVSKLRLELYIGLFQEIISNQESTTSVVVHSLHKVN